MTEASDPEEPSPPAPHPAPDGPGAAGPIDRSPGLTTFTIEGRRAPGLFVVGWLATVLGFGLLSARALGISGIAGLVILTLALLGLSLGTVMLAGAQTIERRAAGRAYAGPAPLLVLVAGFATYALIGIVVGIVLLPFATSIPSPLGDLVSVVLQAAGFFAVLRLLIVGPGVLAWRDMGWLGGRSIVLRGLWGGAVFVVPLILASAVVVKLAVDLTGVNAPSPLPPTGTLSGLILHLLAGAVVAPLSEEMLFRGFALTAWRQLGSVRGAILRSSIVFVLAHVLFVSGGAFGETVRIAFVAAVVRIPVAFTLGWLFVRTGSIWASVGLHAGFNGILIVLAEAAARA